MSEEKMPEEGFYIHKDTCIACEACAVSCPQKCISVEEGVAAEIDQTRCIHCGTCMQICPVSAVEEL